MGDILVEAKRLGRKTMAGWYDYDAKGQCPVLPQAVADAFIASRLGDDSLGVPGMGAAPTALTQVLERAWRAAF